MSVILTGINADIKCIDCPMRDLNDNCMAQEHSGNTWEEMKESCPMKSIDGLLEKIRTATALRCKDNLGNIFVSETDLFKNIKEYCGMEEK